MSATRPQMPLPIVWPGAGREAIAAGARWVRYGCPVGVALPGSFVWDGFDHELRAGVFVPTHRAWGRGTEPLVALSEREFFPAMAGDDQPAGFPPFDDDN